MEREGVKEMLDRRVLGMQHPIKNLMNTNCTEKISSIANRLLTHTWKEWVSKINPTEKEM